MEFKLSDDHNELRKFLESLTDEERKIFWRHQDALHENENLDDRLANLDRNSLRMPPALQGKLKDFLSSAS